MGKPGKYMDREKPSQDNKATGTAPSLTLRGLLPMMG
jgi:hypothetical protein